MEVDWEHIQTPFGQGCPQREPPGEVAIISFLDWETESYFDTPTYVERNQEKVPSDSCPQMKKGPSNAKGLLSLSL